jgi:hypothetical protein
MREFPGSLWVSGVGMMEFIEMPQPREGIRVGDRIAAVFGVLFYKNRASWEFVVGPCWRVGSLGPGVLGQMFFGSGFGLMIEKPEKNFGSIITIDYPKQRKNGCTT